MKDNISIIFATIIGVFLIVILPLYSVLDRQDSMSYNVVLTQTTKFVDDIRNNGFIDRQSYINYISALSTTSNTYKVTIEAYKKRLVNEIDENGDILKDSYVEEVELYNTQDILEIIENDTNSENINSNKKNNVYLFDVDDEIYVKVYNTNITAGSIIYNFIAGNHNTRVINVSYGGVVNKINWELYNKVITDTSAVPEVIMSVPVNAVNSTNIREVTSFGTVGDIVSSSSENYTYLYDLSKEENKTITIAVELRRFDTINIGLNTDGSAKFVKLDELKKEDFEGTNGSIENYIKSKYIELDGMYADIDLSLRQQNDYYVFDITLTNVRMSFLDFISSMASVIIYPGLGQDENGSLSLGAESVHIELLDNEISNTVVLSDPYNWKKILKTGLRDSLIKDGLVYKDQELAFILSYTGINEQVITKQDIVNAVKAKLKIHNNNYKEFNVYTLEEIQERYGENVAKQIQQTYYSNHVVIKLTYDTPTNNEKKYIELEDAWISTGIDWTEEGYVPDEELIYAKGAKSGEYKVLVDNEPPLPPMVALDGTLGDDGWYTSDVILNLVESRTDTVKENSKVVAGGSGVYKNTVELTGAIKINEQEVDTLTLSTNGISNIKSYAYDYILNKVESKSQQIKIDKTAPTAPSISVVGVKGTNDWYVDDVNITITPGIDNTSGVLKTTYKVIGANQYNETTGTSLKITKEGISKITATTYDKAGNKTETTIQVKIDKTLPSDARIEVLSGDKKNKDSDWYTSDVKLKITLNKGDSVSGLDKAAFSIDGNYEVPKTYFNESTKDITITSSGIHEITVYTYSKSGNVKQTKYTIKIDKEQPNIPSITESGVYGLNNWYTSNVLVLVKSNGDKGYSDEKTIEYTITSKSGTSLRNKVSEKGINITQEGENVLTVYSVDNAGNEVSTTKTIKIDKTVPQAADFVISGVKGLNDYYTSNVTISYKGGLDEISKIKEIILSHNEINADVIGQEVTLTTIDNAGNESTKTVTINVDKTLPTNPEIILDTPTGSGIVGVNLYNKQVNILVKPGTDTIENKDNVLKTTYEIIKIEDDGKNLVVTDETQYTKQFSLIEDGRYIVIARTYDKAGNVSEASKVIWIDKTLPITPKITKVNSQDINSLGIEKVEDKVDTVTLTLDSVEIGNTIQIVIIDESYNRKIVETILTTTRTVSVKLDSKGEYSIFVNQINKYGTTSKDSNGIIYIYK